MSGTAESPISVGSSSASEDESIPDAFDENAALRLSMSRLQKKIADQEKEVHRLKAENLELRKARTEIEGQVRRLTAENAELRSAIKAAETSARPGEARAEAAESRRVLINRPPSDSGSITGGRTVTFDRRGATIGIRVHDAKDALTGLTITAVEQDSQADKQGLTADDVVVDINGNSMIGRTASTASALITASDKVTMKLSPRNVMPSDVESRARKLELGEDWKLKRVIKDALRSVDPRTALNMLLMPRDEVVAMHKEQSGAAAPTYGEALLGLLAKPTPAAASSPEYPDLGHDEANAADEFDAGLPRFSPQGRRGMTAAERQTFDSVNAGFADLC